MENRLNEPGKRQRLDERQQQINRKAMAVGWLFLHCAWAEN